MIDGPRQHIHTQHHARPTASGRIIHRAMLVGSKITDLHRIERPLALPSARPARLTPTARETSRDKA
jgi:hypothetical protein